MVRIDSCARCGRQDMDTVDMLCVDCTGEDDEKGGDVSRFRVGVDVDGQAFASLRDSSNSEHPEPGILWAARIDEDGDLELWSQENLCGLWLDPAGSAFLEAILAEYRRSRKIPRVVPLPAEADGLAPIAQDQVRDVTRTVERLAADMRAQAARLDEASRKSKGHGDRLDNLAGWAKDLGDRQDSDAEWQTAAERRLAAIEKAIWDLSMGLTIAFKPPSSGRFVSSSKTAR